jgi:hypothetical protein
MLLFFFRISGLIFRGPAVSGIPISAAKRKAENTVAVRKIGPAAVERKSIHYRRRLGHALQTRASGSNRFALGPGGPRHRTAAVPGAISLRSIPAFGRTAPAKAAYAATVYVAS